MFVCTIAAQVHVMDGNGLMKETDVVDVNGLMKEAERVRGGSEVEDP